jgi:hypothetical protein
MQPSDDRPPPLKHFKRNLETEAAESMFAWLRYCGHLIEEIRWPDREREGRKGQITGAKTVDLTFREDGREVGVDIIELHESAHHARQYAEMGRIVGQMEQELTTRIRELNPGHTIVISWHVGWLPGGKAMREGLEVVKATILASAVGLRDGDNIELSPKPDFIPYLEAHCSASLVPTFGFISMPAQQTVLVSWVAESMAEFVLASSKPAQLKGFTDARVLAIDRAIMPFPAELRAAFEARGSRIPPNWTAIYFVFRRADGSFSEVWSRRPG